MAIYIYIDTRTARITLIWLIMKTPYAYSNSKWFCSCWGLLSVLLASVCMSQDRLAPTSSPFPSANLLSSGFLLNTLRAPIDPKRFYGSQRYSIDEIQWNVLTSNEIYWNWLKSNGFHRPFKMYWNLLRLIEIHWNHMKLIEIHWNQLKRIGIYWNLIKSMEIHWNSLKSNESCYNQLKSPEIQWNWNP